MFEIRLCGMKCPYIQLSPNTTIYFPPENQIKAQQNCKFMMIAIEAPRQITKIFFFGKEFINIINIYPAAFTAAPNTI